MLPDSDLGQETWDTAMASSGGALKVDVDPFSLEYLNDPYPHHERMRKPGPIIEIEKYGVWGMARYGPVSTALQDWETFISGAGMGLTDLRQESNKVLPRRLTLEIDPPEHGKYRTVLTRVVTPQATRKMRDDFTKAADVLVDELLAKGTFDAIPDLAQAYPLKVFPDAIGMRSDGRENLLPWSDAVFNSWGPDNELSSKAMKVGREAYPWIMSACERDALAPGRLGVKIYEAVDRGEIDKDDAPLLVRPFLTAGLDTTIAGLGAAILALATHPDQWRLLRENPRFARGAFEEAIRWESPIQVFARTTSRPVTVGEVELPANAKVLMFFGAANRDPLQWDAPEKYQITRRTLGHVAFGIGIHNCVGQMIARLEGEIILAALAKRITKIELAGEPRYKPNNTMRGLSTLPITVSG
jgi:4-methoxybenzoate monooxygenase (O-demethylating)